MEKLSDVGQGKVSHSLPFRRPGSLSTTAPDDTGIDFHPSGSLPFPGYLEQLSGKVSTNPTATTTGTITMVDNNRAYLAAYRRGGEKIGAPTRVLTTADSGVTYTETNTLDSLDTIANGDWITIVSPSPFWGVFFDVANVNGATNTMQVAYWDGAWQEDLDVAGLDLEDSTHDGTGSLAQDGTVRISKYWATKMTKGTFGTVTGYALRVGFVTAALDSATSLTASYVVGDHSHYIELPYQEQAEYAMVTLDAGTSFTASHGVGALTLNSLTAGDDYVLVGSKQPFMGVAVNVGNTNGTSSTLMTVDYWGGSTTGWTGGMTVAGGTLLDGTDGTESMDQDGLVLWDPGVCSLMQQTTINGITAYWVQLVWDQALDSSCTTVSLYTIRAEGVRYPHYFTQHSRTKGTKRAQIDASAACADTDTLSLRAVQIATCDTSFNTADYDFEGLYTNHSGLRPARPGLETTA